VQGDAQTQLSTLRDEGNKFFGKKDYAKALECYDKALKSLPASHQDKPLLHSNKAACHMMGKK
jgi:tetratricopeptide (TPR) repeat protein